MENMEPNKYDLGELLLYLENKLSDKDSERISNELLNDEAGLNYMIELAKIKSYTEKEVNKISFSTVKDQCTYFFEGAVNLLQEKELSFRGQEQLHCYKYSFFDLIITLVQNQNNLWEMYLESQNRNSSYTIINDKGELISRKNNNDVQHLQFSILGNYYLLLKDQSETRILEISI